MRSGATVPYKLYTENFLSETPMDFILINILYKEIDK